MLMIVVIGSVLALVTILMMTLVIVVMAVSPIQEFDCPCSLHDHDPVYFRYLLITSMTSSATTA